jgi:hypothetical protein
MRRLGSTWILAVGIAFLAIAAPTSPAARSRPASAAAIDCSATTAKQLVTRFDLNSFFLPDPVGQFLCGPFTGPGSEAMAITITAPTCWPIQRWAVLAFADGQWRLVLDQPAYLVPPLEAVGSDLKETTAVSRAGDNRCNPTGGTHARLWHWDGSKLVAGAWTQVKPADPVTSAHFDSPKALGTSCSMLDRRGAGALVQCESVRGKPLYMQKAILRPNGAVSICRDHGIHNVCHLSCGCEEGDQIPELAYGRAMVVGRFRCASLRTGIRCTVTRTGKGFLLNKNRAVRIG